MAELSRALAEALAEVRQVLADLKARVAAEASPGKKDTALERVEELEEAITSWANWWKRRVMLWPPSAAVAWAEVTL